jgi:hypothetical protein
MELIVRSRALRALYDSFASGVDFTFAQVAEIASLLPSALAATLDDFRQEGLLSDGGSVPLRLSGRGVLEYSRARSLTDLEGRLLDIDERLREVP